MISSASSPDRTPRPELVSAADAAKPRAVAPPSDRVSTERAKFLRAELERQPEIRPEVVERGRRLAADQAYPSAEIVRRVAAQILAAPDLTEEPS